MRVEMGGLRSLSQPAGLTCDRKPGRPANSILAGSAMPDHSLYVCTGRMQRHACRREHGWQARARLTLTPLAASILASSAMSYWGRRHSQAVAGHDDHALRTGQRVHRGKHISLCVRAGDLRQMRRAPSCSGDLSMLTGMMPDRTHRRACPVAVLGSTCSQSSIKACCG